MMLHANSGFRGTVIDLDTGQRVQKVVWLDMDKGLLEALQVDKQGRPVADGQGNFLTVHQRGRFRFVPALRSAFHGNLGAPLCARCGDPLTLPGDELCFGCSAYDRGEKELMHVEKLTSPVLDQYCGHPGCARLASWSVADEVIVSPLLAERRLWERGATVGRRWYCSWHYQPPKIVDARGEVVEELVEAGGVRPE